MEKRERHLTGDFIFLSASRCSIVEYSGSESTDWTVESWKPVCHEPVPCDKWHAVEVDEQELRKSFILGLGIWEKRLLV